MFGPRDLLDESLSSMLARPGRALLTVLGTLLGVAAFVSVLGLTATASGQISARFTALSATEVIVEDAPDSPATAGYAYPADTETRLTVLNGVRNAGLYWKPSTGDAEPRVYPRPPSLGDRGEPLTVTAATPGYLAAVHAGFRAGRPFDSWHDTHAAHVAVLGRAAAARLGVTRVEDQPAIFIGDVAFTVIGIIEDIDRQAETLLSVLIPSGTAAALWGLPDPEAGESPKVLIDTELGAAQLVGDQAALALRPDQPERFKVMAPPDPEQLKTAVSSDLSTLFLALAGICLLIGAVGIANTTLVAVLERTAEIGLRRALGARGRHIAAQFLAESAFLGLLGGVVGAALGVSAVIGTALLQQWTPILAPTTVLPAPLIGALTGLLAGLYPAHRATQHRTNNNPPPLTTPN
ncbi:ABC transporter permease [Actinocorallia sp. A-T 12471]|uniref:ABC transporter permease n=1 Tax=Actinocorallia sp. A-T 12471 TaxID=3089813 RepID=UPI0029D26864|nr:ABC transporter permease [Actinocorallia sp. A-T 12471]MDX6742017.1 ABC transporter permease [Actinocorallia sp. A-T 12471]